MCRTLTSCLSSLCGLDHRYAINVVEVQVSLSSLQVNWSSEMECFETFLRELAYFYVPETLVPHAPSTPEAEDEAEERAVKWQIQHVLFPTMSRYLVAPKSLLDRDVVEVANLPDLYRIFERC